MTSTPLQDKGAPCRLWRCLAYTLPLSAFILAGCVATTEHARESTSRHARSSLLSKNRADPLGAYLASRDFINGSEVHGNRAMASTALDMLGIKYRFGGGTPSTGFDCSGLVTYAARKSLGLKLPHRSADIARQGMSVNRNELQEGDLVFFNTRGHRFSHVGIYLGDKKFVHAPRTGSVVRIESMDVAYWANRYNGARRLHPETTGSGQSTPRLHSAR
ncbi:MAG TPA: C40 family peptidase [Burkholderiaceae bacterium]|nr:C40 family peptidase [Burkholderiaceae bacterium]